MGHKGWKQHTQKGDAQGSALPSKAWLSNGVELLFQRNGLNKNGEPFDVIIVGSGYGGSIAASELSQLGLSICLLERGKEFLPGTFPASMNEAPTEFRTSSKKGKKPKGNLEGLYDVRLGEDLNIVQANGLGGGSLINAGVMARANDHVFDSGRWPDQVNAQNLDKYYSDAELLLGSKNLDESGTLQANTILLHENFKDTKVGPAKYESLRKLAEGGLNKDAKKTPLNNDSNGFRSANITVNMLQGKKSSAGLPLNACNLCGDCASGCNNNAKISLDKNLLVNAARKGVEIFTGATVLKFQASGREGWQVSVVYTDAQLRSRQSQEAHVIETQNLILSAGALGSTEILKRSQSVELPFSKRLGEQFSSNGDMLAVGYDQSKIANAISDPKIANSKRNIGPTITGMIDLRNHSNVDQKVVIQEMAVPAAAGHFFTELYSTVNTVQTLWSSDKAAHAHGSNFNDPAALRRRSISHTSLYAVMGNDGANGKLVFKTDDYLNHEGTIQVEWSSLKEHPLFDNQIDHLKRLSSGEGKLGGAILPNPVWQLLKPEHMNMMNVERGGPLTVHPLGGCPMGNTEKDGATNHRGQVFKPSKSGDSTEVYNGLIVLDGAIVPEAVGINPALTISALSLKAIRELINDNHFAKSATNQALKPSKKIQDYYKKVPYVRSIKQLEALAIEHEKETEIQITERLIGFSKLENDAGALNDVVIELTLWSKPTDIDTLSKRYADDNTEVKIEIDRHKRDKVSDLPLNKIRLYRRNDWDDIRSGRIKVDIHEVVLDELAKFIGEIDGNLTIFSRAESYPLSRVVESGWGWFLNRGLRDLYQAWRERSSTEEPRRDKERKSLGGRFANLVRTLSRAGEIRTLNYDITVTKSLKSKDFSYFGPDVTNTGPQEPKKIIGVKQLTYQRRANPWSQLAEVYLQQIPSKRNIKKASKEEPDYRSLEQQQRKLANRGNTLTLDTNYLTKAGIPLIQITQQQNQLKALMDISSFGAYVARMLLGVHFYSFRAPDSQQPRQPVRLAGKINDLPTPVVHRLLVDEIPDDRVKGLVKGQDVEIVITHYAHKGATRAPVMMLHGYSGNSIFFAHPTTPNSLAKYMHDNERDVWLVDLRTSSALPSARYPWEFESVSSIDIPRAVGFIFDYYQGKNKIDVISHCMGSVMLGMSILRAYDDNDQQDSPFFRNRINRIVFSQATPTVVFTQDNNFRSFATSYLKEMIPDDYQFQVKKGEKANQLLDRVLYTLPYPRQEFDIINAPLKPSGRAEYARTRHRVDAFFSRTFELANLSEETLDHIDDFFGPIHVDTIVQASRFANNNVATSARGDNRYVSRERLQKYWRGIPTMSFHSRSNGLVDFSTGERTKRIFQEAGLDYKNIVIEDQSYGHQDSIIGARSHLDVFPHIVEFLNADSPKDTKSIDQQAHAHHCGWIVEAPAYGPIIIDSFEPDKTKVMLGSNVARACHPYCIFIPIVFSKDGLKTVGRDALEQNLILDHYIEQSLKLQNPSTCEEASHWNIISLPSSLLDLPQAATSSEMDGLAALMIYDDLIELDTKFVVDAVEQEQQVTHFGKPHSHIDDHCSLRPIISKVISDFLQSSRNVTHEFSKSVIEFKARQHSTENPLTFALGSCQYPAGMLDKEVAYNSYQQLNQRLESSAANKPSFIALVGDQIYADATAGFLDPSTKFDRFVLPYYRLYENQHVRSVLRKLPLYAMLDDHELSDNWEPVTNNPRKHQDLEETRQMGVESFLKYQRGLIRDPRTTQTTHSTEQLWYSFKQNEYDFFMCDTRTERSARTAVNILSPKTTIMHSDQESAIENWLINTDRDKAKFILTSSVLLPRHHSNHASQNSAANCIRSDGWDGYPVSLYKMLATVVDQEVENLVFLSGDEHIGCYAEIEIHNLSSEKSAYAVSAHCPGLYTPFPFANGRIDGFEGQLDESSDDYFSAFSFEQDGSQYRCEVKASFELNSDKNRLGPVELELCGGFLIIKTA